MTNITAFSDLKLVINNELLEEDIEEFYRTYFTDGLYRSTNSLAIDMLAYLLTERDDLNTVETFTKMYGTEVLDTNATQLYESDYLHIYEFDDKYIVRLFRHKFDSTTTNFDTIVELLRLISKSSEEFKFVIRTGNTNRKEYHHLEFKDGVVNKQVFNNHLALNV
jgi:hypothetical protein